MQKWVSASGGKFDWCRGGFVEFLYMKKGNKKALCQKTRELTKFQIVIAKWLKTAFQALVEQFESEHSSHLTGHPPVL